MTIKNRIKSSHLTNVEIISSHCSNQLSKNNYGYFEFKHQDKLYQQRVGKSKCKEISAKQSLSLYYYPDKDEFYFPEITDENYHWKFIIPLTIILVLGLIPYKLFLK